MGKDLKIKVPKKDKKEFKIMGFIPIYSIETTETIDFDYTEIAQKISNDMQAAFEKRLRS